MVTNSILIKILGTYTLLRLTLLFYWLKKIFMNKVILKVNQGREFLFSTPTKSIEFLNGLCILFFGLVVLLNISSLGTYKFYASFSSIAPIWVWWISIIVGFIQLKNIGRDTLESNIMSVLMLKVSAFLWLLFAILFGAEYPPLSTGFFTYLWFSVVCLLGGFNLGAQNTYELLLRDAYRNN